MANATGIEWIDFSSNPIRYRDRETGRDVWACVKHSPGCGHCYSESIALRFGRGGPFTKASMEKVETRLCEKEAGRLLRSKTLTGKRVPDAILDGLFAVMALRPDVTFQVLTKRADRMAAYVAGCVAGGKLRPTLRDAAIAVQGNTIEASIGGEPGFHRVVCSLKGWPWPLPNVWLGFSAERQQEWDARVGHAGKLSGWQVWCSAEPLLGPIDMGLGSSPVRWVVCGGESGAGARPFELDWARSIQDQCGAAGVPWFFKQAGSNPWDWTRGDPPNHEPPQLVRLHLRDRKGGDLGELPARLRVREFPAPSPLGDRPC